ncbi:LPXTG cell wall anchor domain-containing protein [Rathayibacter toxicus]|uniref:Gram-positive cocci surface proteins LPxTG domain-containing protein n=1 Tax=Rathayibacter toxicus TaxID=145458 RepID=A0A0C5BBD2_9MICO|nr:LPXTG cell wall anchor domain-containing protein [Rathayibacter toxicus]AJM78218.1 hypothetical protein TI83_10335 [Rathayibacter toxicus]ALS57498.1 hypothetical protein APU90_06730 [Rathayibacter toxicus]KKM46798.1 hypothetical protein VT73_01975 [Rathayibacter toxicus]PPG20831.1 hypothetical protein C5D15_10190 [Rathayibacter toxicus]PPG45935.1 hypothetical protein C5D16_10160 [Rathayibacter toxicus]
MTRLSPRPLARGIIAAAALSLALAGAAPAYAATGSEQQRVEEILAHNGGGLTIKAGPEYAGYDVVVSSPAPRSASTDATDELTRKVSLDAGGTGHVVNLPGPVKLYFSSPSGTRIAQADTPDASATIVRGAEVTYLVSPVAHTSSLEGSEPTPVAPQLADYKPYILPFTNATVSPSRYERGKAFDLTFSNVYGHNEGDLDGLATSVIIYSDATTIGTHDVTNSTVTQTIAAEYTKDPHTVALMDKYGRILAVATLDGGASPANDKAPATTPATPVVETAAKTTTTEAQPSGAELASTGVEAGPIALLAGILLTVGIGGLVLARRRATV